MRLLSFLLLLAIMAAGCVQTPQSYEQVHVTEVVDGDTIVTAKGETIRLLGINAPEEGHRYSTQAAQRLADLVLNRTVQLEATTEDTDQYGRSLRYVHVNGTLVNRVLVAEGLATTYYLPRDDPYYNELTRAENTAREQGRGLWTASTHATCIDVTAFNWDAPGNDNHRLRQEYVTFQNTCTTAVDVTGWTVKDDGTNQYTFAAHTMAPDGTLTLHTGRGQDNETDLYWERGQAVWNNDGDAVYLRDTDGLLVAHQSYLGQ